MGTRSDIIVEHENGTWKRIYCHWDGYIEHNGKILQNHYNMQKFAELLVQPGDLSSLAPRCSKPRGHSFNKPKEGYCVYYGRDRGENDTDGFTGDSLEAVWPEADSWTEYTYVWRQGLGWFVTYGAKDGPASLRPLALAIAECDRENAAA